MFNRLRARWAIRRLRCDHCGAVIDPQVEVLTPGFHFCSEACSTASWGERLF